MFMFLCIIIIIIIISPSYAVLGLSLWEMLVSF